MQAQFDALLLGRKQSAMNLIFLVRTMATFGDANKWMHKTVEQSSSDVREARRRQSILIENQIFHATPQEESKQSQHVRPHHILVQVFSPPSPAPVMGSNSLIAIQSHHTHFHHQRSHQMSSYQAGSAEFPQYHQNPCKTVSPLVIY